MEPTSPRPEVAVGAIAVRDGSILLIRRGQPPSAGRWSVPGGRVEWGESLAEAVRREVEEETGLTVEVGGLAGVVERGLPEFHYVILDYFVTVTGGSLRPGGDVTDTRWVTASGLAELELVPSLLDALGEFGVALA
ncbi:MAG TPA: NUDIX domain-containing protein [Actinomycetota bacterium]|nr:NUDIX domain-containing protein [Actinomycetota bacterium]